MSSTSSTSPFQYQPLKSSEIRVFKILPEFDTLCFELKHINLYNEPGEFITVSYVWGNPPGTAEARINRSRHSITQSLSQALRQFQELAGTATRPESPLAGLTPPYWFWADGICINQEDTDEKSRQIPMMGDIYSISSRTLSWLGDIPSDVDPGSLGQLFEMAGRLASHPKNEKWDAVVQGRRIYRDWTFDPCFEPVFFAWCCLVRAEWFKRSWTQQEAVISYDKAFLSVGPCFCTLKGFVLVSDAIDAIIVDENLHPRTEGWVDPSVLAVLGIRSINDTIPPILSTRRQQSHLPQALQDPDQGLSLFADRYLKVLLSMGERKATIPHDLIYSRLVISAVSELPSYLAPNYRVPYPEVCLSYFKVIICYTPFFTFPLTPIAQGPKAHQTWIPDMGRAEMLVSVLRPKDCFLIKVSDDAKLLTLRGLQVDIVAAVWHPGNFKMTLPSAVHEKYAEFVHEVVARSAFLQRRPLEVVKKECLSRMLNLLWENNDLDKLCKDFELVGQGFAPREEHRDLGDFVAGLEGYFRSKYKVLITLRGLVFQAHRLSAPDPGDIICKLVTTRNNFCLRRRGEYFEYVSYCFPLENSKQEPEGQALDGPDVELFHLI
ncbi:heterokaryon incompatibility protein-domain-containing protein [Rhypophila decipiens]|uniref:Heterokaryon incompatibility protein-domain-containing protein n=1 Tax=Rhypophila decipiens TaxID=261697 RepID=A0AAN7B2A5_9PEZI|nr:heterokaryon incompatibility protein-domain-containing protein [Rhypophila decipiens]